MKFDPETIYDLAADTARVLVGELYRDRDGKYIESAYKRLLNKPESGFRLQAADAGRGADGQ